MLFSAAVSMGDYCIMFGTWGKPGVYAILRSMRDAGVRRVYWRTLGAGQAPYPSQVTEPLTLWVTDRSVTRHTLIDPATAKVLGVEIKERIADFAEFDHQACARDLARRMGIEFYLWHEAHMESHSGQYSSLILNHPEWRAVNRWGEALAGNLSWGFPEAIDRRMDLLKEALSYEPDGIALDLMKGGDYNVPRVDQHGYSAIGYETPVVDAFKNKTGKDPFEIPNADEEWVRFRASYVTEFIRKARACQQALLSSARFGLFMTHKGRMQPAYPNDAPYHPEPTDTGDLRGDTLCALLKDNKHVNVGLAGPLEGNLEDVETWLHENLLDFVGANIVHAPGYPREGAPLDLDPYRTCIEQAKRLVGNKVPFGTQLRSWRVPRELVVEGARAAKEAGCEEVVFMEAQGIQANNNWDAVKEAVEKCGA